MSASKSFSVKVVACESHQIHSKISELETEWTVALLRRIGIPKVMINKALNDERFGSQAWRDYLFDSKGIQITRHIKEKQTEVFKINLETGKKTKVGQWSHPEIVRVKKERGVSCELHLKYWQIL